MMGEFQEEFQKQAQNRANLYEFLSGCYSQAPSYSLVKMIRDGSILSQFDEKKAEYLVILQQFVHKAQSQEDMKAELTAEYTRLFLLPKGVSPYESVYLDERKHLGGRISIAVGRFYKYAQANLLPTCLDVPDHIGVELEFMKFLCTIEKEAWELLKTQPHILLRCARIENEFLQEHLLRWAFLLCDRVKRETKSEFYRAIALLSEEFLRSEQEYTPQLLELLQSQEETP